MNKTHWKKLRNPDYLGAYALEPGQELILTIKDVKEENVAGSDGKKKQCSVLYFIEKVKPMVLNSENAKTIEKIYKTPYIEDWSGKKIQIFIKSIKAFGEIVDSLRIRPYIPKQSEQTAKPIMCECCAKEIQPFQNMTAQQMAQYTKSKYGMAVCSDCAVALAEQSKANEANTNETDG